jgi:hypothetical protein
MKRPLTILIGLTAALTAIYLAPYAILWWAEAANERDRLEPGIDGILIELVH